MFSVFCAGPVWVARDSGPGHRPIEEPRRCCRWDMFAAQAKSEEACVSWSDCLAACVGVTSDDLAPEGQPPSTGSPNQNGPVHPRGGSVSRTKERHPFHMSDWTPLLRADPNPAIRWLLAFTARCAHQCMPSPGMLYSLTPGATNLVFLPRSDSRSASCPIATGNVKAPPDLPPLQLPDNSLLVSVLPRPFILKTIPTPHFLP